MKIIAAQFLFVIFAWPLVGRPCSATELPPDIFHSLDRYAFHEVDRSEPFDACKEYLEISITTGTQLWLCTDGIKVKPGRKKYAFLGEESEYSLIFKKEGSPPERIGTYGGFLGNSSIFERPVDGRFTVTELLWTSGKKEFPFLKTQFACDSSGCRATSTTCALEKDFYSFAAKKKEASPAAIEKFKSTRGGEDFDNLFNKAIDPLYFKSIAGEPEAEAKLAALFAAVQLDGVYSETKLAYLDTLEEAHAAGCSTLNPALSHSASR